MPNLFQNVSQYSRFFPQNGPENGPPNFGIILKIKRCSTTFDGNKMAPYSKEENSFLQCYSQKEWAKEKSKFRKGFWLGELINATSNMQGLDIPQNSIIQLVLDSPRLSVETLLQN
jgi:hypothetical protein